MAGFPNLGGSKDQTVFRSIIISLGFVVVAFAVGMACSPQKKSNNNRSSNSTPVQACETFSDSAACSNSGSCQWTGSLCSGDMEYCGKFVAQNNCPISCQWNTSTSKCQPLPMQSQNISCGTYTNQQACLQVSGCTWNGYNCITSAGTAGPTTGTPFPTTGNPFPPTTGGLPTTTTGNPATTTGDQAPVTFCANLTWFQCLTNQGCRLAFVPSFGCVPMQ